MEVVRGVHQIKIPFPQGVPDHTNVYVVEGSKGSIMIDAGWDIPEAFSSLRNELEKQHLKLEDIRMIVITHLHPDHYGLAGKLRQLCDAKVAMHSVEAELINSMHANLDNVLRETERELRHSGVPQDELPELGGASLWMKQFAVPESPDIILNDGAKIDNGSFEFQVLRTPGHSPGHICLYESGRRLLFSGDHILFDTIPHVGFNPQSGDNPLDVYINSLRRMEDLSVNFVFPGHGPVFNGLKLRIAEIVRYREQRKRVIVNAISNDLKTAYQIAAEIPWMLEQGGFAFKELTLWDRRLAVMETIAHLRLLMSEGEVVKVDSERGVDLYLAKNV